MPRIAVYAGSFDPVTLGHLWVMQQGARLFDRMIVAIGTNPGKVGKYMFSEEERLAMVQETIISHVPGFDDNTAALMGKKFLFQFAKDQGAQYILRGVRNAADFEFEKAMATFNELSGANLSTVFLVPPTDKALISSSFVKDLIGYDGWRPMVSSRVPSPVMERIELRFPE